MSSSVAKPEGTGPLSPSWKVIQGLMRGEQPESRKLGVKMRLHHVAASRGHWNGEVVFERGAANSLGIIHGGFLASILDVAMGYASLTLLGDGESQRTLEIKVNFLRGVPPDRVRLEGDVLHRGRQTSYCEGSVRTADGELIARASATFAIRRSS